MQGAEERRLRRMEQYAASLPRRKPGEERALARLWWEGNAALRRCRSALSSRPKGSGPWACRMADDALMVNQDRNYLHQGEW